MTPRAFGDDVGRILQDQGWSASWTTKYAIERWESLVERVERGYSDTLEDYTNDLAVREWIDLARKHLGEEEELRFLDTVRPIDERFLEATFENQEFNKTSADEWWYRRLPKVLGAVLKKDVENSGIDISKFGAFPPN